MKNTARGLAVCLCIRIHGSSKFRLSIRTQLQATYSQMLISSSTNRCSTSKYLIMKSVVYDKKKCHSAQYIDRPSCIFS
jgi:hypothetical protein